MTNTEIIKELSNGNKIKQKALEKLLITDINKFHRKAYQNNRIKHHLRGHNNLHTELLNDLIKDKDYLIRASFSSYHSLNTKQIKTLSKDNNYFVKQELANRTDLELDVLLTLTKDSEDQIRVNLAKNNSIKDKKIICILCKDLDLDVRIEMLKRKDLTHNNIKTLMSFDDFEEYLHHI
jgi:hypothetical protein